MPVRKVNGCATALNVDHTSVAIQAAEDGLGIALVPLLFIERQLAERQLADRLRRLEFPAQAPSQDSSNLAG
ncbi:hypothetical protein [Azospirillum ramasamyi]|uniref:Uncharacterized protein n=1 Tax=Azospirillum ramasamyi TaxID=682998 RepID=A0A2U9S2X1_9PROT|nr:hypothetical protein [Azospirillum ramasamyi]AWU93251.1 hypothetical protein DM194_02630 [Azospirillum ramasamyi]